MAKITNALLVCRLPKHWPAFDMYLRNLHDYIHLKIFYENFEFCSFMHIDQFKNLLLIHANSEGKNFSQRIPNFEKLKTH